jgi:hypothetical protein
MKKIWSIQIFESFFWHKCSLQKSKVCLWFWKWGLLAFYFAQKKISVIITELFIFRLSFEKSLINLRAQEISFDHLSDFELIFIKNKIHFRLFNIMNLTKFSLDIFLFIKSNIPLKIKIFSLDRLKSL